MRIILAWGAVLFTPTKAGFNELQHKMSFGFSKQELVNKSPLYQATQGIEYDLSLSGVFYTKTIGHDQMLNILKAQGESQKPYFMADGRGRIYGKFILQNMEAMDSYHLVSGIPQKQEYSLNFSYVSKKSSFFNLF